MHLLVLLAVIPSLGLPVLATLFVRDGFEQADSAARVEKALRAVAAVDRLRTAISTESISGLLGGGIRANAADLPTDLLAAIPPSVVADASAIQRTTDAALAAVPRRDLAELPGGTAGLAAVRTALTADRQASKAPGGSSSIKDFQKLVLAQRGVRAGPAAETLERLMVTAIGNGQLGISTPELLRATAQTQAVSSFVITGQQLIVQLFQAELSRTVGTAQLTRLIATVVTFESQGAELSATLTPALTRDLRQLLTSKQYRSLSTWVADFVEARTSSAGWSAINTPDTAQVLRNGIAAVTTSDQLSALLRGSVTEGVDVAQQDRAQAQDRARVGLIGTAALLLVTLILLIVLGGLIRARLRDLAAAAHRLSSGTLAPMPVRGPREIAIVSEGLNDAVTNLREVTTKAALIASGDVSSPMLEQRSPGQLGAAMHASFQSVVTMVREREAMRHELAHQASHDALTGLSNRAEAERLLAAAVDSARHGGNRVSLMFVDLDHFKSCNDNYGHAAGDLVLQTVAHRLETLCEGIGVACRLGGDEFLIVVPEAADDTHLTGLGQRIVDAVREPVFYGGHALQVGASVGLSAWSTAEEHHDSALTDTEVAEWMLLRADQAVYRAKSAGRNAAVF